MAKSKLKIIAVLLTVLVVFCAGGWFFTSLAQWGMGGGEVAALYNEDGESVGIFDNVPAGELAAAEAVASYGLDLQTLPSSEQKEPRHPRGADLPSQIVLTDRADIVGFAPPVPPQQQEGAPAPALPLDLTGTETALLPGQDIESLPEQESRKTLLELPVKVSLIKTPQEYKEFKTRARGNYPEVNFSKQMLIVLESGSQFPDNAFEIRTAELKDGKVRVTYAVSLFDLDKKLNTHAVAAVDRSDAEVELEQVL